MIQVNGLVKRFPTVTALDHLSLQVNDGEFFGLLGPNGAGKSTLMSLLVGYLDPDEGEIRINGQTISRDTLETRRMIGLVPQSLALYDDISAQDNLEIFGSFFHIDSRTLRGRIREKLEAVQLYDRRKDKVKTFSGGMKRRLNLIAGLLHEPQLLLCDEPTVGVDPQSRNAIFDYLAMLNRQGKTIVYTTHYMEEAERLCTRLGIIDFGRIIAEGTTDQLLNTLGKSESITIAKNPQTAAHEALFRQFGDLIDGPDKFELVPHASFRLSEFYTAIEQQKIGYEAVERRRPTLEALFLNLTGRSLRD